MKLTPKLKALVVAIGMVGASHAANAAVVNFDATTGNSSFLFFAFDSAGKSFIKGLDKRLDDIVSAPTTTQTFALNDQTTSLSTFFSGSADAVWGVVAADGTGAGFKNFRIVTTFDAASLSAPTTRAGGVKNGASSVNSGFTSFVNTAGQSNANPLAGTIITSSLPSDPTYAGTPLFGSNWGNNGPTDTTALLNGALLGTWLLDNGSTPANSAAVPQFRTQLANFKLDLANNQLIYAPAAAVPVPAALWLLGSALTGLVGVSRRRD